MTTENTIHDITLNQHLNKFWAPNTVKNSDSVSIWDMRWWYLFGFNLFCFPFTALNHKWLDATHRYLRLFLFIGSLLAIYVNYWHPKLDKTCMIEPNCLPYIWIIGYYWHFELSEFHMRFNPGAVTEHGRSLGTLLPGTLEVVSALLFASSDKFRDFVDIWGFPSMAVTTSKCLVYDEKSHLSKWMMTEGSPMTSETPILTCWMDPLGNLCGKSVRLEILLGGI